MMPLYVFYTAEGETYSPTGAVVENLQLMGFARGLDYNEALSILLDENAWITCQGFDSSQFQHRQVLD